MSIHGVPGSIRMDQARCQTGNIIRELCNRNNIKIIFAPANDHRSIGLVERLMQTVKRRLGCINLDPKLRPFYIKQSSRQIAQEIKICRKKATKISPNEAHFGPRANTPITNIKTKPKSKNIQWPKVQPDYLDDNIMGEDELITDERWEQEGVGNNSDEEVRASKERMLTAAKNETGDIPRTFRMTPNSSREPVAESSKGPQLARKTIASTRSKKQLQGLYKAIPEGAALVKTSNSTSTIKYRGQDDTVLHKLNVARLGTPAQPRIPLIQFAARKTVINHHKKLQRTMNVHQREQMTKLKGERTIRKRQQDSPTNPNLANLTKVHRTKVPPKRKYVQSPKKGGTKKVHIEQSTSSQEGDYEDEDETITAHEATTEADQEDLDYEPKEAVDIDEITKGKKPRRSNRSKKKPLKYGLTENLSTDDDGDETQTSTLIKGPKGIASFQPDSSTQDVSTQGQDNSREDQQFQDDTTQPPAETEPTTTCSAKEDDQVLEISVQSHAEGERES